MNFDYMNDILPVGSIVGIRFNNEKFMITGYAPKNEEKMYDYVAVVYPYGFDSYEHTLVFNKDLIKKVYFVGFKSDSFKEIEKEVKATLEKKDN